MRKRSNKLFNIYKEFNVYNVSKNIHSHPYSYDPFMIFFNDKAKKKATGTSYSDNLLHEDWDKHNLLCKKHFGNEGQYWDKRDPKKIEAFLSDFFDKKVILVANIQYVNVSNGFPVWRFDFYDV